MSYRVDRPFASGSTRPEKQRLISSLTGRHVSGVRPLTHFRVQSPLALLFVLAPRFRFTLAHELGHLVLHRKLPLRWKDLDKKAGEVTDVRSDLHLRRHLPQTPRQWLEWQANSFASALILPRATLRDAIAEKQTELGINRRRGTIFVDRQWHNIKSYYEVLNHLQLVYQASRTMLILRLGRLELLTDWRDFNLRHISALLSEDNS